MPEKPKRMDENRLKAVIKQEIQSATGYVGGEISEARRRAMEYYLAEPFGNEVDGRSQVVSNDVFEIVEGMLPDFVEMFAAGDQAVVFEPTGPEDIQVAEQATDLVNHIWLHENPGFEITHDWIKDALLQKNGYIKIVWDESEETSKETYEGLNILAIQELIEDPEIEIKEHSEREAQPEEIQFTPDGILHDVTVKRTVKNGRVKVFGLPPEEFLNSRRAVTLDDATFLCHKYKKTYSELVEMGFDRKVLDRIPSHNDQDYNEERVARFDADDEYPDNNHVLDPATREIWVFECWVKLDADGDGIAERRQIIVAGDGYEILENRVVDDHPFVSISPIRVPHKFYGRSLADITSDLQQMKSTVWRQLMDNMYLQNSARLAVNDQVNMDDLQANRPGGIVRVQGAVPVQQAMTPIVTPPLGNYAFPVLEYLEDVRAGRTGYTKYSQGLDADSLNKTATGINQILGRAQQRMLLMARIMAETGFAPAMKKILRLVINHQDRPKVIRLRNEWVPIDPKGWNADMDVSIRVGLGHGTQEAKAQAQTMISQIQQQIVAMQGGLQGPLVTTKNIYNNLKTLTTAMGEKNTDLVFTDPDSPEMQQMMAQQAQNPPPDPKMIEIQQKGQIEAAKIQQKAQSDQAEDQRKAQKAAEDNQMKVEELRLEHERELFKIRLEDERERLKAGLEIETKARVDEKRLEFDIAKATEDASLNRDKFQSEHDLKSNPPEVVMLADARAELQETKEVVKDAIGVLSKASEAIANGVDAMGKSVHDMNKPKKVIRDKDGKITGVTSG